MPRQTGQSTWAEIVQLELGELARLLADAPQDQLASAVELLTQSKRIFTFGAGRSGLALRMAAMRFMHLGRIVYVAGETTTPAIAAGDLLIVASASGTSASSVHAAQVARKSGARILVITSQTQSPVAELADYCITLKAATKDQYGARSSAQYAGSLFEQGVLLLCDAIFHHLWQEQGTPAEELMHRHANLE